jgi:hypothetical protein
MERTQERSRRVRTAGRWPWKSASAKKCVTTYLPNTQALKMDGAESGAEAGLSLGEREEVGGRAVREEGSGRLGVEGTVVQILEGVTELRERAEEEKGSAGRAAGKTDLRGGVGLGSKG